VRSILVVAVLLLVFAPAALAAPIRVTLTAQDHHPRVGKRWSYSVVVRNASGKPIAAKVHMQILFGGFPVGQLGVHRVPNGVWRETLGTGKNPPFPAAARGQALVFQAVVTAAGQTVKKNWPITVR
jgi:hypothetical protein